MKIDGETYACDVCIRGHRTSRCNHSERHLQLVQKKGRPVSQCMHCRSLRTSRSAHIKCDCAKRARDGEGQSATAQDDHACKCCSGERCTCVYKKEKSPLSTAATPAIAETFAGPVFAGPAQVYDSLVSSSEFSIPSFLDSHELDHPDENTRHVNAPAEYSDNYDPYLFQQLDMAGLADDLFNTSYPGHVNTEQSDCFPDMAPQFPFNTLTTNDWNPDQINPMNNNHQD